MEKRYVLGIDAGGTKTHYALYDLREGRAALYTGGCANHEHLPGGYEELRQVLREGLAGLLTPEGLTPEAIDGAGLGIAGVDTSRQHGLISGIFRELGLRRFGLANDAVLGIKCECPGGAGLCAVNGTGFSVLGVDESGNTAQVGGFQEWSNDFGGGIYLARTVFAAVYGQLTKGGRPTAMTPRVLALFGAEEQDGLTEALSLRLEEGTAKETFRELSVILHGCAAEGDPVALDILRASGEEYAAALLGVLRRLPSLAEGPVEVALVGSNFTRCEFPLAQEIISRRLAEALPGRELRIRPVSSDPVAGALFWGCAEAGIPQEDIPREQIRRALEKCRKPA